MHDPAYSGIMDTCQYLPVDVALLLNVSADHMDRYETFADYVASKQQIFSTCKYAIYNLDDANTHPQHEVSHASSFSLVSAEADAYLLENEQELSLYVEDEKILQASELTLKGLHNFFIRLLKFSTLISTTIGFCA